MIDPVTTAALAARDRLVPAIRAKSLPDARAPGEHFAWFGDLFTGFREPPTPPLRGRACALWVMDGGRPVLAMSWNERDADLVIEHFEPGPWQGRLP